MPHFGMANRTVQNYFTGATDTAEGIVAGLSQTWYGNGDVELVSLDNPGLSAAIMERREVNALLAPWVPVGGMTRTSIQRLNLFASGYEYRARLLESNPTEPLRLVLRKLSQIHAGALHDSIVTAFSKGHITGFAEPEANGIIDYGDVDKLKTTTAFMFFCYDPDPTLQALFGGAWEKYGVDYRKLHVNGYQYLLSVAIDDYVNNGGANTGGGTGQGDTGGDTGGTGGDGGGTTTNAGEIGGAPAVRAGTPTLAAINGTSTRIEVYSSNTFEVLWNDAPNETSDDQYEVAINGIVRYIGTGNSHAIYNAAEGTEYTASIVRFRDDGSYSDPRVISATTPSQGDTPSNNNTGGGTTNTTDGTETSYAFYEFDAYDRGYVEQGQGDPAQKWIQRTALPDFTGAGYLQVDDVDTNFPNGSLAVFLNRLVDDQSARRIWLRCRAETSGDQFAVASQGSGSVGTITVNSTDWVWVQSPEPWDKDNSSFQMYGISGGISVDKVIVQSLDDVTAPSGIAGLVVV